MAYLNDYQYYENDGNTPADANWGSYQFVSLADIVNNFLLMYDGNHSLVNNEERYKILFHAKRAIQELNYDAFKEIKALELNVGNELRFILPQDYVNWVRISLFKDGILRPLTENIQINTASAYLQDESSNILFDQQGNILRPEFSELDFDRIRGTDRTMYMNQGGMFDGLMGYNYNGYWYFDFTVGKGLYGLNPETANANPTFNIDKKSGVITFSSNMKDQLCILEYISDGMEGGVDTEITVNKLFEDYVYAFIQYAILNSKMGVQEYIVARAKKNKSALLRNAKIRLSNIHPGRLLMNMRGKDKWIK
jgi:hypothetical protein|tara:strand:- start:616 stop:1542 length:927 start_codon:yes stop_codon:yes gene_type:complete